MERLQWFFDPMCPYAYQASRWIRDVRTQTPLDITWRFFSLEDINREDGKKHPWERPWSYGWGQMRVGALIRRDLGNDARRPLVRSGRARVLRRRREDARSRSARGGDRRGRLRPGTRRTRHRRSDDHRRRARRSRGSRPRPWRPRCADDRVRIGVRRVRARRRSRADGRRRARTLGSRARHAAVPAPLRAPAPEDG